MDKSDALNAALLGVSTELSEVRNKQRELFKNKVETDYDEMLRRKAEHERAESIDLSVHNAERIKKIQQENLEYLKSAQKSGLFINQDFEHKVPYFPRNIILCVAQTGEGKSTTCANLCAHALKQGQKVLVITNEEAVSDVYNRVTCIFRGWPYANHEKFTPEQIKVFGESLELLSHRMVVVDDAFNDSLGQTSTIEGIESTLKSLINKKAQFDVIIIDYYQNIDRSIDNPYLKDWEVQGRAAKFLDKFKNQYDAPIILLAQQKPSNGEVKSFKESIEGRKAILNVATCAIEIKAKRDMRCTTWTIKKSRFPESVGETIYTGYDRGRYVRYTEEFKNRVQMQKDQQEYSQNLGQKSQQAGLSNVFNKQNDGDIDGKQEEEKESD